LPDTPTISKSRNHKITNNFGPSAAKKPFKLLWSVKRQGGDPGFDVQMNRTSDRDGAEEFARRWGVIMPKTGRTP
jgi:hypothetical protein